MWKIIKIIFYIISIFSLVFGFRGFNDDTKQWKEWLDFMPDIITPEIDRWLLIGFAFVLIICINVLPGVFKIKREEAKYHPSEDQEAIESSIKQQEQLTEKEIDFKIILTDSKAITAIENEEGQRFLSNPTLEMSVTFLPNRPMQFAELYLRIEKEEIRPSIFDLNLPYIIKDGETHKIIFQNSF